MITACRVVAEVVVHDLAVHHLGNGPLPSRSASSPATRRRPEPDVPASGLPLASCMT